MADLTAETDDDRAFYHRRAQIARSNGFVTFCTAHNRARCGCLAPVYDMTVAGAGTVAGSIISVSLPTQPVVEQTPIEETQTWRDRPPLL